MAPYLAGVALGLPAVLVWHMPRRWWVWLDQGYYGSKMVAFLRCIPAFTLGAWLLFGLFYPIDTAMGGNRPGQASTPAEIVAGILCAAPTLTTSVGGWPQWMVPPGARNQEETAYFTGHWAGIFGFMAALLALNFGLRGWWSAAELMVGAALVLGLLQIAVFRRGSPTAR